MGAKVARSLGDQFQLVEERFADGREWVHGGRYTVSDPYLYVFTRWLDREGAGGIARFPGLAAHRARIQARPAVKKALETEGLPPV
jgi:glutathione S-transferase